MRTSSWRRGVSSFRSLVMAVCLWIGFGPAMGHAERALSADGIGSQMGADFKAENRTFSGEYPERWDWKGAFCKDYLWTLTKVAFQVGDSTDFQLNDDGSVDVYGDLYNVGLHAYALYKSGYTLCHEAGGWLGVRSDRVQIRARLYLPEDENASADQLKVVILSTKFGTLHLGKDVPHWLETKATYLANHAVTELWRSKLGAWATKKLGRGLAHYLNVGD